MHEGEIAERFIQAAEIDIRLPAVHGPKQPRSLALPYIHDFADVNGYGDGMQLARGEKKPRNRLKELSEAFFDLRALRVSAKEVSDWEECIRWGSEFVSDDCERRALWAWAISRAGGLSLNKWARREGIHPNTGRARKDRALAQISAILVRNASQHSGSAQIRLLQDPPQISDVSDITGDDIGERDCLNSWIADGAFAKILSSEHDDFSWAAKRNQARRQREQQRRKQAA